MKHNLQVCRQNFCILALELTYSQHLTFDLITGLEEFDVVTLFIPCV